MVYASIVLFPHPFFRISVGNAVPPARFNGLANITATLGSFYWLGFETSGLSPDKKRLALLGAQRLSSGGGGVESEFNQAAYRRRQQRLVGYFLFLGLA
jgi:hypothetical protein